MESIKDRVQKNDQSNTGGRQQIELVYYTDPLCCWSWAFEPKWRKMLYEFDGLLNIRYCMGGLLPDWSRFNDAVNCISRPVQMGPVWMQAAHISGMPLHNRVWIDDPPASSYLACIAVKAAGLQSAQAGTAYLRAAREAIMMKGINIARLSALVKIAETLSQQQPALLDLNRFKSDIAGHDAKDAFRRDLGEIRLNNISRIPSLLFRYAEQASLMAAGYRSYNDLLNILQQICPGIKKTHEAITLDEYTGHWKSLTERELQEVFS